MAYAARRRVAPVGYHVIACADRELRERFAAAGALGTRELEEVARQRRQAHAVVHAPQRAGLARLLHRGRVKRPQLEAAPARHRDAVLLKQPHAQRVQPLLRLPQALQQRHIRQVGQIRLSRPHHRLPQRVPAPQMDQQRAQQVVHRLVLAQPLQRAGVLGQLPPLTGQERHQQVPVLVHRDSPPVSVSDITILRPDTDIKLALMPCAPPSSWNPKST